jgi:hypothetical protein
MHLVPDVIESAVKQAKAAANGKNVGVHGADTPSARNSVPPWRSELSRRPPW